MTNKRVKIHYRKLRRDNEQFPEANFRDAIVAALEVTLTDGSRIKQRVRNRLAQVPGQDGAQRLLNNFHAADDYAFGTICLFSPGQLQALLKPTGGVEEEIAADALEQWDIEERAAPTGNEYLHAICYWYATGDHFYQIQHTSLQSKSMEEYFTWLLRDKAGVIGDANYVELKLEFDRDQIGDLSDVKSIEVGGLVPETVKETDAPREPKTVEVETRESIADKLKASFAKGRKILNDLLGEVEAQKIIDSMPEDAALDVTVNIGYRAKKRKLQKEFMRNLESGLRNIPDGEIKVRDKYGEIKGDDARLSADMSVKKIRTNSSLLDLESAREQMAEVHRRFVHDGKITL
jgi:hypothetical protein